MEVNQAKLRVIVFSIILENRFTVVCCKLQLRLQTQNDELEPTNFFLLKSNFCF